MTLDALGPQSSTSGGPVPVSRRKGDAGRADMLFSRLIRSRGVCERCGQMATDAAHIVRRGWSATRCVEDNAWALCRSCHRATEEDPKEFVTLVQATIGIVRYDELRRRAQAGLAGLGMSSATFWLSERTRMEARCKALGVDTRWKQAS